MRVFDLQTIQSTLDIQSCFDEILETQKQAFIKYTQRQANTPMPLQLDFTDPPGDCHIKAGYCTNRDFFVIKVATGFYNNPKLGLPSGDGCMMIFNRLTGQPLALFIDHGWLTQIRTAMAAVITAITCTTFPVDQIGIIGTGDQSFVNLQLLAKSYPNASIVVWGRNIDKSLIIQEKLKDLGVSIDVSTNLSNLMKSSQLIVSATTSKQPLILEEDIQPNTHIIALGADGNDKHEVAPSVFEKADQIIVDSQVQSKAFGDFSYAIKQGIFCDGKMLELGEVIQNSNVIKTNSSLILTDLTGIATQDMVLAELVYQKLI